MVVVKRSIPGVERETERALLEQFDAFSKALEPLQRFPESTPERRRIATQARVGELVRVTPPAAGLPLQLPQGNEQNKGQAIRVSVGSVASGGSVSVTVIGAQTIDGASSVELLTPGLTEFRSLGSEGWTAGCCVQQAWPIGSIFMSANATNPADLLGFGTWTAFGTGRMPVAIDSGQVEFDTMLETGGSKTNTPTGTVSAPVFTGTASIATSLVSAGTPAGTCSAPTFTGTVSIATSLNSAGTPSGTVSAPTFTGSALATHQHALPIQAQAGTTQRTVASFGNDGTSTAGVQGWTTAASVTTGPRALSQAVSAGTPAGTCSAPNFTGAALSNHQHTLTPAGTVSAPTFTGTPMGTHQHTLTPAGTNSVPTFTGASGNNLPPYIVVSMWQRTA